MKVLFVYKYLTAGGVEAVLRVRLETLPAAGIEAHAWFLHDYGGRSVFAGLEPLVHVGSVEACIVFATTGGFDLVGSIDTEEVVPGLAGAAVPWFLECHSGYLENLAYLPLVAAMAPRAVLTPSAAQRDLVRDRVGGLQPRVVPNALASSFMAPLRAPAAVPPRPVAAWIGRLDRHKNWPEFLALGSLLLAEVPELELWLVGRPVDATGAQELLAMAGRTDTLRRLRWLDGLAHQRVPALLDAVRASGGLLISTSRRESFGLTVVEAMARACPVLVPAQPPFTDLVESADCLFAPRVLGEAAEKGARLLRDESLAKELGGLGRERALARFAPEVAIPALARELRSMR